MRMLTTSVAIALVGVAALTSTPAYGSSSPAMTAKHFEIASQRDVNKEFPQDNTPGETTRCAYIQREATTGYMFTCVTSNKAGKQLASTQITLTRPKGDVVTWNYLVTAPTFPRVTYTVSAVDASTATVTYADGTNTVEIDRAHLPFTVVVSGTALPSIVAYDSPKLGSASITCKMTVAGYPPVTNTGSDSFSVAWCY